MARRLELQAIFKAIPGVSNVYFQPPSSLQMTYPCIRYEIDDEDTTFANNKPYRRTKRYQVTVLSKDPDDPIVEAIADMEMASFSRGFTQDNLHHTVYQLYF